MEQKKTLGQYFTTNQQYILSGMKIPDNVVNIIEPFAGEEHLLDFITDRNRYNIECFDIDPKKEHIIRQDTINDPPSYTDNFIITNPPYLARNKTECKVAFDNYDTNDLFKCFLKNLTVNHCLGGIVVVPLNFWSSIRKKDVLLRKLFLEQYKIVQLNIFEENVFDDTSYTVCSFQFEKVIEQNEIILPITIYPSKTKVHSILNDTNNFLIGGEIYYLPTKGNFKIYRLTKNNIDKQNTNIIVKCIDDNLKSKIGLSMVHDKHIYVDTTPNRTARTYATLIIEPKIDVATQTILVEKFNSLLDEYRNKYNSLFLSNYRESKDLARKRISFDLVYSLVEHILDYKITL
jgi:hypothetical protein